MPLVNRNRHLAQTFGRVRQRPVNGSGSPILVPEFQYIGEKLKTVRAQGLQRVLPSQFVEFYIRVPDKVNNKLIPFTFDDRRYLLDPYNTQSNKLLLKCGRQVEKSTTLGNTSLAYTCILSNFSTLYVSPTHTQTKEFSQERIKNVIELSPKLKPFFPLDLVDNINIKQSVNRSMIRYRYAFLSADRVRGIPADKINIDEIQDVSVDNIPVIEQCAFHSPFKIFTYSGTPKTLDNTIEYYWSEFSTQNEWMIPCDNCGGGDYRYWNIVSEKSIGKFGLVCDKCGAPITAAHEDASWVSMNPDPRTASPFEGYRISQLMVPFVDWASILDNQIRYGRARFYNEILGLSYDSGSRPLTQQDVFANCDENLTMSSESIVGLRKQLAAGGAVFAGLDWGADGIHHTSFTVLTLAAYIDDRFTVFLQYRFEGQEIDPTVQVEKIIRIIDQWKPVVIGCDYGGGFYQNRKLVNRYGEKRVMIYQYASSMREKMKWEPKAKRFMVNRTEIMSDVFQAIKNRNVFRFPRWEEFRKPFAQDFMNIFSEFNEQTRVDEYKHNPGSTDDSFHSFLYCFLASTLPHRRPDVF